MRGTSKCLPVDISSTKFRLIRPRMLLGLLTIVLSPTGSAAWRLLLHPSSLPPRRRVPSLYSQSPPSNLPQPSLSTALCIIPPDETWDAIQRCRHVAHDPTYTTWPPAIRLFHPFCSDAMTDEMALQVAAAVEDLKIEPFDVKLTKWTVIPHAEVLERDWTAMEQLPTAQEESARASFDPRELEIQKLIANEERVGRVNKQKREERRRAKSREHLETELVIRSDVINEDDHSTLESDSSTTETVSTSQATPKDRLEHQKRMYDEFNGPCVVVLEPDSASRAKLQSLRHQLLDHMGLIHDRYSPTSSVSPNVMPRISSSSDFRPVVPIGTFPTTSSAIAMARKLRSQWKPLQFTVTDIHVVSNNDSDDDGTTTATYRMGSKDIVSSQFGCDALIMLMGQEMQFDDNELDELTHMVYEKGEIGGAEGKSSLLESDEEDESSDLEHWLSEDPEFDEGTVVVIGRTHFFTGEMRLYVGMPATSVTDSKGRIISDVPLRNGSKPTMDGTREL